MTSEAMRKSSGLWLVVSLEANESKTNWKLVGEFFDVR